MPVSRFIRGGAAPSSAAPAGPLVAPDLATIRAALRVDESAEDARLTAIASAAAALANRQAPDAPAAVATEGMLRFIAYLYEGPMMDEYQPAAIWRRCGAAGMLSPWTVRRAGVIEKPAESG